ncbi:hypothetical protein F511_29742 [Dorcoceras hygrometricum]|uniref:Uncharacterized protein n=1 Tax=Dorcoceras hygrometricum TaxID=472368 RepID=A0A2Z7BMW8_9LAMI|nr:hypothetical protein F511_29742 [Dorcoceras hygrometricum]
MDNTIPQAQGIPRLTVLIRICYTLTGTLYPPPGAPPAGSKPGPSEKPGKPENTYRQQYTSPRGTSGSNPSTESNTNSIRKATDKYSNAMQGIKATTESREPKDLNNNSTTRSDQRKDNQWPRLRQSGPRPDSRLLRQTALEVLTRSARSDSPRKTRPERNSGKVGRRWRRRRGRERRGRVAADLLGIQLAVGPQPLWLRNHNSGPAQRIMVKRLATPPHDPLGITDSACKNQSVVVSVLYGPFNPYIPIRSTTIGKSRVARDPMWLRNHNAGPAQRIMVKRLATSPHDPLGITDSACKNQSVVVSVLYDPFNPYIPIRSTTIGKSRVARDPIAMHTSWRSNSDIASVTRQTHLPKTLVVLWPEIYTLLSPQIA